MKINDPQSFDHLAEDYDVAASLERDHSFFLNHLPERRNRVLDVGCGTGLLAYELSRHFASVTGLDLSEPMLAIARRKRTAANIEYRQADANKLVLKQTFDAIVSHTAFHHLNDIPGTLSVLKNALEPGGRLILVDNVNRWSFVPRCGYALFLAIPCLKLLPDLFQRGARPTWQLFRFRVSRPWLDHRRTDRYLSPAKFRELYSQLLPGASFTALTHFMGIVWQAPAATVGRPSSATGSP